MDKKSRTLMARSSQPVRITIPASVAYDLPAFQKGLAGILDRLGCSACCSGFDIAFLQEREFIIDEKLEIRSISSRLQDRLGPHPEPWISQGPMPLRVTMPTKVSYNLEQVQQVLAKVAGRLGCEACCSGFDIAFMQERELIFDEALNIQSF